MDRKTGDMKYMRYAKLLDRHGRLPCTAARRRNEKRVVSGPLWLETHDGHHTADEEGFCFETGKRRGPVESKPKPGENHQIQL